VGERTERRLGGAVGFGPTASALLHHLRPHSGAGGAGGRIRTSGGSLFCEPAASGSHPRDRTGWQDLTRDDPLGTDPGRTFVGRVSARRRVSADASESGLSRK
jgi:hypothetical protein